MRRTSSETMKWQEVMRSWIVGVFGRVGTLTTYGVIECLMPWIDGGAHTPKESLDLDLLNGVANYANAAKHLITKAIDSGSKLGLG